MASLLVARAASRARETALRLALGASRGRLLRQSLVEGLVLTLLGAAAGVLAGYVGLRALLALAPDSLGRIGASRIDLTVFAFTLAISRRVGPAVLPRARRPSCSGPAPQRLAVNRRVRSTLTPVRYRTRATLVVVQIALSVVLLVGAGLLVRAFVEVQRVDTGFRADRHLTFRVALPDGRYRNHRSGARRGGRAAAAARGASRRDRRRRHQPSSVRRPAELGPDLRARGRAARRQRRGEAPTRASISTGLFETLGVQLLEGRFFTDDDSPKTRS